MLMVFMHGNLHSFIMEYIMLSAMILRIKNLSMVSKFVII